LVPRPTRLMTIFYSLKALGAVIQSLLTIDWLTDWLLNFCWPSPALFFFIYGPCYITLARTA
jgi:hypothetical protein